MEAVAMAVLAHSAVMVMRVEAGRAVLARAQAATAVVAVVAVVAMVALPVMASWPTCSAYRQCGSSNLLPPSCSGCKWSRRS